MAKPSIEQLVSYFKSQIPGCRITPEEIDALKGLYNQVSVKDLNRVFHAALRQHALQPVSYMTRQLRIIHPAADPFNSQIGHAFGQQVNGGTDWQTVYAKMDADRDRKIKQYEAEHGKGSWAKKDQQDWDKMRKIFTEYEATANENS